MLAKLLSTVALGVLCVQSPGCTTNRSDPGLFNAAVSTHELRVGVAGGGTGSIDWTDWGGPHTCAIATCFAPIPSFSSVALTATPSGTSTFAGWIGDCSGTSPTCTVSIDRSRAAVAAFSASGAPPLVVSTLGQGTVTGSGYRCGAGGGICTLEFVAGAPVGLTATADPGQTFIGWAGAGLGTCNGTSASCTLTKAPIAESIRALFTGAQVHLDVVLTGTGSGGVTSSPGGIRCGSVAGGGGSCGGSFDPNTSVTLTATPTGSSTATWYGDCAGTPSTASCTLTMDRARSVRVGFDLPGYVPGKVAAGYSSIGAVPLSLAADGVTTSLITVRLLDSENRPVVGASPALTASGSNNLLTTPLPTDSNGTTTATLASTTAEAKTVTAVVDGVALRLQAPGITFTLPSTASCNSPYTRCGSTCVDARADVGNCGACGVRCAVGTSCNAGVCTAPPSPPPATDFDRLRYLATKRVYFQHASVGGESVGVYQAPGPFTPPWGIQKIMADNPGSGCTLATNANTAAAIPAGSIGEWTHGAYNGNPDQKLTLFDQAIRGGLGGTMDIAVFKLGTPDIDQTTGVMSTSGLSQADWFTTVYKPKMDALAALYPRTIFVHATVPIHAAGGYYGNVYYEEWNSRLRASFPGRVFDVAYWESVNLAGNRAYGPDGAPCIHADWAIVSDAHVNQAGANWLGEKLLEFLANVR